MFLIKKRIHISPTTILLGKMFFEKLSIMKLLFNVKKNKSSLHCYSTYQMLFHCAYLHQGNMERSSNSPILELEKLKHSEVLFKILSLRFFFF